MNAHSNKYTYASTQTYSIPTYHEQELQLQVKTEEHDVICQN